MSVGDRAFGAPENRADQVRARRVRKTRKIERAGRFKTTKPRRNKRARRRYAVPVSADNGTEIQLQGFQEHILDRGCSQLCCWEPVCG